MGLLRPLLALEGEALPLCGRLWPYRLVPSCSRKTLTIQPTNHRWAENIPPICDNNFIIDNALR